MKRFGIVQNEVRHKYLYGNSKYRKRGKRYIELRIVLYYRRSESVEDISEIFALFYLGTSVFFYKEYSKYARYKYYNAYQHKEYRPMSSV